MHYDPVDLPVRSVPGHAAMHGGRVMRVPTWEEVRARRGSTPSALWSGPGVSWSQWGALMFMAGEHGCTEPVVTELEKVMHVNVPGRWYAVTDYWYGPVGPFKVEYKEML